jgi:hypothetical protein
LYKPYHFVSDMYPGAGLARSALPYMHPTSTFVQK